MIFAEAIYHDRRCIFCDLGDTRSLLRDKLPTDDSTALGMDLHGQE